MSSILDSKEIKSVNPKGSQPWIFSGRTDAKAEVLWAPDAKSWLIGKDPDDWKDWGKEEKVMTEDEMFGWHHQLNEHEIEQISGDSEGREDWHAAAHRSQRVGHNLANEQQQQTVSLKFRSQILGSSPTLTRTPEKYIFSPLYILDSFVVN